jgi:hypothetical protein
MCHRTIARSAGARAHAWRGGGSGAGAGGSVDRIAVGADASEANVCERVFGRVAAGERLAAQGRVELTHLPHLGF